MDNQDLIFDIEDERTGIRPFCVNHISNDPVSSETVKKAQNGDDEAFSRLFWQTYRYVFSISRKYLRRDEDIYDAVQETYVSVYTNLKKLKVPEAFVNWVGKIAATCARSIAEKSALSGIDPLDDGLVEIDETANGYTAEVKADVTAVLDQMDPKDVELLTYVYYDGLKVADIARMQGVPASTVYSRLESAKRRLKELLKIRGIEKAVYGGDIIALITTAIRNAIGTNLLSMAVAGEILHSVLGNNTKESAVISAVARKQRNSAALKIASFIMLAVVLTTIIIVLLIQLIKTLDSRTDTVNISDNGSTISLHGSDNYRPQGSEEGISSLPDPSKIGSVSNSSADGASSGTASSEGSSSQASSSENASTDTSGNIGNATEPDNGGSNGSQSSSSVSTVTSSQNPSSAGGPTASSRPTQSSSSEISSGQGSSTPSETAEIWYTEDVPGGVEITGIKTESPDGIYEIPSKINGKTVVGIGKKAFYYETGIKSITLPETVQYIDEQAFAYAKSLTSIVIPSSCTRIGLNAFTECRRLSAVYIKSTNISVDGYAFSTMYQRDVELTVYAPEDTGLSEVTRIYWDADYVEWNG